MKARPGPARRSTDSEITSLQEELLIPISGNTVAMTMFKKDVHNKFCYAFVDHLGKRFPDLPLIKAFQLSDPQLIPSSEEEVETYGNDLISDLADHYHVDTCTAQQEWESLRSLMETQEFKDKQAKHILKSLSSTDTLIALYPILSRFAQVALTLPVSNADAERGFSSMNCVKTELRNGRTVSSLDTLLLISTEGPEKIEFSYGHNEMVCYKKP